MKVPESATQMQLGIRDWDDQADHTTWSKLARLAFWAAATFALVMALLPHPPQVPGSPSDKIQHIAAFATLALLARIAYPGLRVLTLLIALSALGATIEIFQAVPALHRDSDHVDWIADTGAAAFALLLTSILQTQVRLRT